MLTHVTLSLSLSFLSASSQYENGSRGIRGCSTRLNVVTREVYEERVSEMSGDVEARRDPSPTTSASPRNPLAKVIPNPLSDTTTTSDEPARPSVVDQRLDSVEEQDRTDIIADRPFSSTYHPSHVQDPDGNQSTGRDGDNAVADSHARDTAQTNGIDATWSSNTLTLASSSTAMAHPPKHHDQNGREELDWEETWERQKRERWQEKVRQDLEGWRGGHG